MFGRFWSGSCMAEYRVGQGFDIHRFADDRPLVIGGIRIPSEQGLEGHSDADVLLHAICDAILGACGLPDIGVQFPNGDAQYRNADSAQLLTRVYQLAARAGMSRVVNIDAVVMAERPTLAPYVDPMKARIAELVHVTPDRVQVKATTLERLGALGRQEGVAAMAVCLIEKA